MIIDFAETASLSHGEGMFSRKWVAEKSSDKRNGEEAMILLKRRQPKVNFDYIFKRPDRLLRGGARRTVPQGHQKMYLSKTTGCDFSCMKP
jgi:hypothetical protein